MIKQYLQTSSQEPVYLEMWEEALAGIQKHLLIQTKEAGLKIIAELPDGIGGKLSPKMDHLVCFLPGAIALGATGGVTLAEARTDPAWSATKEADIELAKDLTKTCWAMYAVTETGLAPELAWFHAEEEDLAPRPGAHPPSRPVKNSLTAWKQDFVIKPRDAHNLQRPETVETLLVMYRITGDPLYREWGWRIFQAWQRWTRVENGTGYASVNDVNETPPTLRDNMESFWLVSASRVPALVGVGPRPCAGSHGHWQAETLKYLYLLFSPPGYLPLTEVVFNTEGHVFPRIRQDKWKTGWQRNRPST